ncbi:hypothetical protein BC829DRAFT_438023 [Chytridium lagenaria]|nr:hypothetical protein BC829DRAFT_438023 [Chytridium lagenaria]
MSDEEHVIRITRSNERPNGRTQPKGHKNRITFLPAPKVTMFKDFSNVVIHKYLHGIVAYITKWQPIEEQMRVITKSYKKAWIWPIHYIYYLLTYLPTERYYPSDTTSYIHMLTHHHRTSPQERKVLDIVAETFDSEKSQGLFSVSDEERCIRIVRTKAVITEEYQATENRKPNIKRMSAPKSGLSFFMSFTGITANYVKAVQKHCVAVGDQVVIAKSHY